MKLRDMLIADEDKVFVEVDGSQAEARVVAWQSDDFRMNQIFEDGLKIHRYTGAKIFGVPYDEIAPTNDDYRYYLGKKTDHASNYGLGGEKLRLEIMKDTDGQLVLPVEKTTKFIEIYYQEFPGVKKWHMEVEDQLRRTRILTTPLGRKRQFFGRMNADTFREAYAYVPQSTVVDWTNMGMLEFSREGAVELLLQDHDSFKWQCEERLVYPSVCLARDCLKIPIIIRGIENYIPIEFKVGKSLGSMKSYELEE